MVAGSGLLRLWQVPKAVKQRPKTKVTNKKNTQRGDARDWDPGRWCQRIGEQIRPPSKPRVREHAAPFTNLMRQPESFQALGLTSPLKQTCHA